MVSRASARCAAAESRSSCNAPSDELRARSGSPAVSRPFPCATSDAASVVVGGPPLARPPTVFLTDASPPRDIGIGLLPLPHDRHEPRVTHGRMVSDHLNCVRTQPVTAAYNRPS